MGRSWRRPAAAPALVIALAIGLPAQPKPEYEVYAIRYATIPDFAVSGLVAGSDPSRKLNIAMMVWLVRGAGKKCWSIPVSIGSSSSSNGRSSILCAG